MLQAVEIIIVYFIDRTGLGYCVFFFCINYSNTGDGMGKIKIICQNCGKEFEDYQSNHRKFCCLDCKNEGLSKRADSHKIKQCIGCGKTFRPKENRTKFCSYECYNSFINENSYTKVARECKWCGKEFYPNHHKKQFCSKKCGYEWYSDFKSTEEQKQLQAQVVLNLYNTGRIKQTLTKPHEITNAILDKLGVNYVNEYNIKYYSVDIYLPDNNLMIEVMGDYWHSNPTTKYKDVKSVAQQKTACRDKRKHTYILKYYGIEVLYLWESDIEYNADMCEELIKKYIHSNGGLEDYNSYNYELLYDGLSLKKEITPLSFLSNNISAI